MAGDRRSRQLRRDARPGRPVLTQHSLNRVPFVVARKDLAGQTDLLDRRDWGLADIAPTMLKLLNLPQPRR